MELKSSDFSFSQDNVYINRNVNNNKPGMLLIMANWCGHCQRFKPTYNEICKQIGKDFICTSIEHAQLEKSSRLTQALNFSGYPTIKFFDKSGRIISEYKSNDRSKVALLAHICDVYHHCVTRH
uniref:Thioredoxin domain-containing protein n=1 Tax=viral metagenome TaxID=1070528 RepID=A0A6C0E0S2_9ZZZZ